MPAPFDTSGLSAKRPRPSFFRRWFGWLFFASDERKATVAANDAFFASAGTEQLQMDQGKPEDTASSSGSRPRLASLFPGLKPSNKPPSALAKAYADAARTARENRPPALSPAAPPQWRVREPEDRSDPTPHSAQQALARAGWALMAASVRGKLHAHQALWRDDAFACAYPGPWALIAVADGAGSAPLSRVGADRACTAALATLAEQLSEMSLPESLTLSDLQPIKAALVTAARRAQQAIAAEADQRGRPTRDFHTTLLLAVHQTGNTRDLVGVLQVGDGTVGVYTGRGKCSILGVPDHGDFASETRFLTTPGIEDEFDGRVCFAEIEDMKALAVMTDGVADDFFPEAQRLGELFDSRPIAGLTTPDGGEVPGLLHVVGLDGSGLVDWLHYEKKGSSDDRTLVLLFRTHEEKA